MGSFGIRYPDGVLGNLWYSWFCWADMKRVLISVIGLVLIGTACSGDDAVETSTSVPPSSTAAVATTGTSQATSTSTSPVTTSPTTLAGATTSTTSTTTVFESTSTTSTTAVSTPEVVLSIEALWEGETQAITLYRDGTLVAGSAQGQADIPDATPYFIEEQARIDVVELGAFDHPTAILVTLPQEDTEDPPNRYQLFVAEGERLRRVLNESYGVYGITELIFLGDGTAEYQEDGWTACLRAEMPEEANRQIVTLGFVNGELTEISRRDSPQSQTCDELAACPYVYVLADGGEELVGEILRDVRGRDAYTTQGLTLPTHEGWLHVQLREEKAEVTFLDAISVLADGHEVLPRACGVGVELSHCSADGVALRLTEGELLDLWFAVPRGAESLELSATGYYVPTPTLRSRSVPLPGTSGGS